MRRLFAVVLTSLIVVLALHGIAHLSEPASEALGAQHAPCPACAQLNSISGPEPPEVWISTSATTGVGAWPPEEHLPEVPCPGEGAPRGPPSIPA